MAINVGGGGGGLGRGRRQLAGPMADINIIPLVDVVLVLLIIFMLTAHVMEFGLEINVPKTDTRKQSSQDLPVVSISKSGDLFIGDKPVKNYRTLGEELKQRYPGAKAVYIRADKDTTLDPYLKAVAILGKAQLEIRLVTQADEGN
ncbi:MAG: biopolymer transporter ExbD [Bryobacterales bacterium]|nr:biopolymer transporter ExbD [Bryobacterales bacterium]